MQAGGSAVVAGRHLLEGFAAPSMRALLSLGLRGAVQGGGVAKEAQIKRNRRKGSAPTPSGSGWQ
eukprot:1360208-Rhodomonas_salina.1